MKKIDMIRLVGEKAKSDFLGGLLSYELLENICEYLQKIPEEFTEQENIKYLQYLSRLSPSVFSTRTLELIDADKEKAREMLEYLSKD